MESSFDVGQLSEALASLNETAAGLEKRLAEIRDLQKQIVAIVKQAERLSRYDLVVEGASTTVPSEPHEALPTVGEGATFTDAVIAVFEQRPAAILGVDEVLEILQGSRQDATKERVRNALYYADKQGKLHRGHRAKFSLKDTSTPAATGVEVNEELNGSSSREIGGGRDEASTPPGDQGGAASNAQFHLGRLGDRAPIGG
ncbi:hypothetical protein [Mycobacterium colombiense]|uniref:Uncharacterized protein n=1 Tax=Mycobacterium colombiense CECT 3035 TaxID=1041522 RepID=J4JV83_9MYCO|nr:hypothetical protein [Mycobacterium colombiense]EJO88587.1 hypothetical protein MCOL_V216704 [Mycobacterium colombiense CECT 3035]